MELKELESAIEAILFAAGDPVPAERICTALEQDRETVDAVCQRLADDYSYERRGIRLIRLEDSWQMCSAPEHASAIRKTLESRKPARLSQTALEVLAIVAYFQPVTRTYIEQIRGVDSCLHRGAAAGAGFDPGVQDRLAVPGRPIQYRTTADLPAFFWPDIIGGTARTAQRDSEEGAQMTMELEQAIEKLRAQDEAQAKAETAVEVSGEVPEGEAGA